MNHPRHPCILLIEDEPAIADTVVYALNTEGFEPIWRMTAQEGLTAFQDYQPALVILDIGLPDANGFDLCRQLRKQTPVPVIFLTARADEVDRVVGLEIGADDYVVKPFSPRELTARVKAVLRRTVTTEAESSEDSTEQSAPFSIDEAQHRISYWGQPLTLSRYEFLLLQVMLKHPDRVYSREMLLSQVWDDPDSSFDRTVDTHIKTIRAKLRAIRPDANPIKTHRGFGYSLSLDS
ncbi:MAG: two-component system response regulator CreB [Candidatus Competibacteraceae bacterium]|jgi:two-component system catabolic regulation response regulator CreB|nr:two-component system response regulator CreB [Candidatus Competibacteraceae bacterium]